MHNKLTFCQASCIASGSGLLYVLNVLKVKTDKG